MLLFFSTLQAPKIFSQLETKITKKRQARFKFIYMKFNGNEKAK